MRIVFQGTALFDIAVIAYLFFGGAAGGVYFTMAIWSLSFHRKDARHSHNLRQAFKTLLSRTYAIALVLLAVSMACLMGDLLYPERALLIFLRPHASLLTFGAFSLAAQLLVGLVLAIANAFDVKAISGKARKHLEAASVFLSAAIMTYTGLFLASHASVPFWNTPWLVALFLFSSLSSGLSVVLLAECFAQGQSILLRSAKPLQKIHLACLAFEAASLALFLQNSFSNPHAANSIALLTEPNMLATGTVGVVAFGIVVPFLLEAYSLTRKECRAIPFSDVICLIGGFLLRYCIIMCGAHW